MIAAVAATLPACAAPAPEIGGVIRPMPEEALGSLGAAAGWTFELRGPADRLVFKFRYASETLELPARELDASGDTLRERPGPEPNAFVVGPNALRSGATVHAHVIEAGTGAEPVGATPSLRLIVTFHPHDSPPPRPITVLDRTFRDLRMGGKGHSAKSGVRPSVLFFLSPWCPEGKLCAIEGEIEIFPPAQLARDG